MITIVIVGGGWAGCAAALAVVRTGARAVLIERTDMLLGTGLVGGIMRNNGRQTAAGELTELGGAELIRLTDRCSRHRDLNFPGHRHASLYDVDIVEPAVRALLNDSGIRTMLGHRVVEVRMNSGDVTSVTAVDLTGNRHTFRGDCFVDCTGSAGPRASCASHKTGCAMCVLRCPVFGGRISVATLAGVPETAVGTGVVSGSCELHKGSLQPSLLRLLETRGSVVIPLPDDVRSEWPHSVKACEQYEDELYRSAVVLLDTGAVKMMIPYVPLELLRRVPGLGNAMYRDPAAGGLGNSTRFVSLCHRSDDMRVAGVPNLFCAGERAGLIIGHTEAIVTGTLAGHNAVRLAHGLRPIELPPELVCGDLIGYVGALGREGKGLEHRYTLSGSRYFARMTAHGLYETDQPVIHRRVERAGVRGLFRESLRP